MKTLSMLLLVSMLILTGCSDEDPLAPQVSGPDDSATSSTDRMVAVGVGDRSIEMVDNHGMVPFRGVYTTVVGEAGFIPPTTVLLDLWGEGQATHLGNSTWYSLSSVDITTGAQWGSTVEVGANGEEFHYDYLGGSAVDEEGRTFFWGDWTATGGTGRFAGATGGGTYEGTADGTQGTGEITLVGQISMPNGRRFAMD